MARTIFDFKLLSQYSASLIFVSGIILYWLLKEQSSHVFDIASSLPLFVLAGGGGGGGSGDQGTAAATDTAGRTTVSGISISRSDFTAGMTAAGASVSVGTNYASASFDDGSATSWSGNGADANSSGGSNSSTPFLSTWDGKRYRFENDFLFGKPNTAFNIYAEGLSAYKAGIGGDTYFIQNKIKAENGVLKFQIKEIEPEESFIDSFRLTAVDLPVNHYPVTDANLNDTYIFDTAKTVTLENQSAILQTSGGKKSPAFKAGYSKFGTTQKGKDTTLCAGDKIVINLPVDKVPEKDLFLMVDSYFRDWTLGNEVPFTLTERIFIQTKLVTKMFPVWCAALVMGGLGLITKNVSADIPSNQGYNGGGYYNNSRSLVVTVQVGTEIVYLQTIFPRYVQASQEVIRIPRELLKKALGATIQVYITATKKHKVRSAFLFQGTPTDENVIYTPLTLKSAIKKSVQKECAQDLAEKNGVFLHTLPSDVIDVSVKDVPLREGYARHYMLQAHGFYTKLSTQTKNKLGNHWYDRLDKDSKKLLKNLRVNKT